MNQLQAERRAHERQARDWEIKLKKLQEEIKQLFYQSLDDLESISKKKLSFLMSDQLEARRQFDYIQWMESFLRYEYKVLPPNDFIMAWTK